METTSVRDVARSMSAFGGDRRSMAGGYRDDTHGDTPAAVETESPTLPVSEGNDGHQRVCEDTFTESELRYRELADALPHAVFELDLQGMIRISNRAGMEMFGFTKDDLHEGLSYLGVLAPEDHEKARENVRLRLSGKQAKSHEYTAVRKDGTRFPALVYSTPIVRRGKIVGIRGVASDITERKLTVEFLRESEARLSVLSRKLLVIQEEERRRLSQELHDSIGQALVATRYRLEQFQETIRGGEIEPIAKDLTGVLESVQSAIEDLRRICTGLRPCILEDLGVVAGIDWLCRQLAFSRPAIRLQRRVRVNGKDVPIDLHIVIFRIAQEALTNIAKHSRAKSAKVSLFKSKGILELTVSDDGVGFDPHNVPRTDAMDRGLGLSGMTERAELSGGSLTIESAPGKGATIRARWPLKDRRPAMSG